MKKPLYYLDQYEKQRILEMHKTATSNVYLKEEKQPINEIAPLLWLLGIGATVGGAAALYKNWDSLTGQKSKEAFTAINSACDKPEADKLKTLNNPKEYVDIAKKLNKAFDWSSWYTLGMDMGTDNETVTKELNKIKSIGDYCKVKKEYEKLFVSDLGETLMDEVSLNFDTIVMKSLSGAVKKTMEEDGDVPGYKKIEDKDSKRDPGSGGNDGTDNSKDSEDDGISYVVCKGEYYKGCMDSIYGSEIKKLQRCLGIEPSGKFNNETEEKVKSEFNKTKVNSSDISYICGDL
jgi:hypothetical protein